MNGHQVPPGINNPDPDEGSERARAAFRAAQRRRDPDAELFAEVREEVQNDFDARFIATVNRIVGTSDNLPVPQPTDAEIEEELRTNAYRNVLRRSADITAQLAEPLATLAAQNYGVVPPEERIVGTLWTNTTDGRLYTWEGTCWIEVGQLARENADAFMENSVTGGWAPIARPAQILSIRPGSSMEEVIEERVQQRLKQIEEQNKINTLAVLQAGNGLRQLPT